MRGNRKKKEKKIVEKGKVKKQKKMREERKIEKVSRSVIGNRVRHECIIFIKSVLNCIKFSYKLLPAMGTRMAPQYANIFMADLEEKVMNQTHNQPRLYLRYIDDIFMVWTHGEESLKLFHEKLNKEDPNIKLTLEYSQSQVHFLHTTITIENSNISTSLYRKPTHSYSYIHPTSSHPPHTFRSVVYSRALRYKRICSKAHDRNQQLATLKEGFRQLGYKRDLIASQIHKAVQIPRAGWSKVDSVAGQIIFCT